MKKIIYLIACVFVSISCEKLSDCIESAGNTTTKIVDVTAFNRVEVYSGIELIVTDGPVYEVKIVTGENIIENIEVKQENNVLKLKENSACNWVRDYGQTKVYVTSPNIEVIYSKSERNISSNGILQYPSLRLISLDKNGDGIEGAGIGDFHLNINNNQLIIENNSLSRYYISGTTNQAIFNFYFGDGRLEAQNLTAQTIDVFHRGSNDMIVKPMQSIQGKMVSTGDIILKNNPPTVNVEQLYQGQLILN